METAPAWTLLLKITMKTTMTTMTTTINHKDDDYTSQDKMTKIRMTITMTATKGNCYKDVDA